VKAPRLTLLGNRVSTATPISALSHRTPAFRCSVSRSPRCGGSSSLSEGGQQILVNLYRLGMAPRLFVRHVGRWDVDRQTLKQTNRYVYVGTTRNPQNRCGENPATRRLSCAPSSQPGAVASFAT
jgi:hypothetical protein